MRPRPGASSGTRRGRRSPGRQRASAASASQPSSRGSARTRPSARRTAPRRPARPASAPSGPSRSAACATEAGFPPPSPRGSAPPLTLPAPRPRRPQWSKSLSSTARCQRRPPCRPAGPGRSFTPCARRGSSPWPPRCPPRSVPSEPSASPAGARRCPGARARLPSPARHRVDLVGIRRKPNGRVEVVCVELKTTSKDERTHAEGYDEQCRKMPTIQFDGKPLANTERNGHRRFPPPPPHRSRRHSHPPPPPPPPAVLQTSRPPLRRTAS